MFAACLDQRPVPWVCCSPLGPPPPHHEHRPRMSLLGRVCWGTGPHGHAPRAFRP